MHSGCSGTFENGRQIVDKLRMMGFSEGGLPIAVDMECECGKSFEMETFEAQCPHCNMVYGVTPCHAHDPKSILAAGIDY